MVKLANDHLEVSLIPELGGKIFSLKRRDSRLEWLWTAEPGSMIHTPDHRSDFSVTNLGGIDECLPIIKEQDYRGFHYSDHGQVWRWPALVQEVSEEHIITETVLTDIPLRFRRTIFLEGSKIHFQYTLSNNGAQPLPFIWAFHPLLNIESGDRIEMHPDPQPLHIDFLRNLPKCKQGALFSWPKICPHLDLTNPLSDLLPRYCAKLFFKSHAHNTATLIKGTSAERLAVSWSDKDCPYLGLWLSSGAWNGHTHLAFEPTNYPSDSFLPDDDSPPTINPSETINWAFEIHVMQIGDRPDCAIDFH